MTQNTVRLDDCEEEESEVTREARVGKGGGEKDKEEKRERETDDEKMEQARERGEKKRKGDAPQLTKVSNDIRL